MPFEQNEATLEQTEALEAEGTEILSDMPDIVSGDLPDDLPDDMPDVEWDDLPDDAPKGIEEEPSEDAVPPDGVKQDVPEKAVNQEKSEAERPAGRNSQEELQRSHRTQGELDAGNMDNKEKEVFIYYSGTGYEKINGVLRDTANSYTPNNNEIASPERSSATTAAEKGNIMANAIDRAELKEDTTLYRGTDLSCLNPDMAADMEKVQDGSMTGEEFAEKYAGTSFVEHGFTSTSLSVDVAKSFAGDCILIINAPEGTKGVHMNRELSKFSNELEVVLQKETTFTIEKIEVTPDGKALVSVTVTKQDHAEATLAAPSSKA